jgi:hypothetical protein
LNNELFSQHKIEVPSYYWPAAPHRILRVCAHAYNHPGHYERLADALEKGEG